MGNFELRDSLEEAIISYYSGDLKKEEAQELLIWIEQSPENLEYFQSIGDTWRTAGLLNEKEYSPAIAFEKIGKKLDDRDIREVPQKSIRIRMSVFYNTAAAILIIGLVTVALNYLFNKPEEKGALSFFEAVAPKGSRSQLTLTDGTQIWLNAGTTLKYNSDYGISNRDIYLDGEAYFKVAKNAEVPFKVTTSDIRVTALGTAFNVKSYSEEGYIQTTLEEGSLKIDPIETGSKRKNIGSSVILKPNQTAVFRKKAEPEVLKPVSPVVPPVKELQPPTIVEKLEALPVSVISIPDTKLFTSWKDPNWVFKNEKLRTLAPKLERRYDITIEFADTTLLNYAFSGTLKEESIEQVLEIIRLSAPIKFSVDSKEVTLELDKKMMKNFGNL